MSRFNRIAADVARQAARVAATALSRDGRVQLVYLFGSAAADDRRDVGDVDLAVLTDRPMEIEELMRVRADLLAVAGVEIDLTSINDAPVVLAHEIAESGCCLFARDADVEIDFVTRARSRYWDFKPLLDEQWRLSGERVEARRRGAAS